MDVALSIASKRDVRDYDPRPIPDEVLARILDAGRLAGSARNAQPWELIVARDPSDRARLAEAAYSPRNLTDAPVVVAIAVRGGAMAMFDAGRAAQNMMLAAWGEGVASCPNGIADPERAAAALGLAEDQCPVILLSLGYPRTRRDPSRWDREEWSRRASRRPLHRVVRFLS